MTDTEKTPRRRAPISYRPSDEDELRRQAAARGMSINAYIDHRVFGKRPRLPAKQKDAANHITALQNQTDELKKFGPSAISDPGTAERLSRLLEENLALNSRLVTAILRNAGWRP